MKAMILAAGRGKRLRPLTDEKPKPLLEAGGRMLVEHHIEALVQAGLRQIVINHSHLGNQIEAALGDGERYGADISYSQEPAEALETGGGIHNALPLLGSEPFLVVNGDVWTDFPFARLSSSPSGLIHLILVDNPPHNPTGDFALRDGRVERQGSSMLTYSGIGVFRPELFSHCKPGRFSLAPLIHKAVDDQQVSGEYHGGDWQDIGTPERLAKLQHSLRNHK